MGNTQLYTDYWKYGDYITDYFGNLADKIVPMGAGDYRTTNRGYFDDRFTKLSLGVQGGKYVDVPNNNTRFYDIRATTR
jgi:hypothetical protein